MTDKIEMAPAGKTDKIFVSLEKQLETQNFLKDHKEHVHDECMATVASTYKRLTEIEQKSDCGSIKALDAIANFIERCGKALITFSTKVRHFTFKISAPCAITFPKKAVK